MSDELGPSVPHRDRSPDWGRREFLTKAGRFAAVTPPAISMLLVTSMNSDAVAASGGGGSGRPKGNNGWGNGGGGTNPGSAHGKTAPSKIANIRR